MSEQSGEFLFTDNLDQLRQSMHQNLQGIVGDLRETGSQLDGTDIGAGFVDNLVRDIATKGSQAVQTAREVAERIKEALASGTALPTGGFAGAFKAEAPQLGRQMEDYFRLQVADLPDTVRANPKVQQILGDAYEHVAKTVASGITAERQGVADVARNTPGVAQRDAVGRGQNPALEIERALGGFATELRSTLSPFGQDVTRFQAEGREVAERIRAAAQGGGARLSTGDNAAVRAGAAGQGPLAGAVQPNAERSSFAVDLGGAQAAITGDFVEGFTKSGPIVHDILRSAVGEAGPVLSTSIKDALAEGARIIAALGSGEAVRIGGKASPNVAFPADGSVAKLNSAGESVPLNVNQQALLQQGYAEQITTEKAKQQAAEAKRTAELSASIDRAVRNEQAANEADVTSTKASVQHADLLNRRARAQADVDSGAGVTAGKVTFSSQGATETGTGRIVNDFNTLRSASQSLSVKLEQLAEAEGHANKTPIDGLVQGLFGAGGRKRTGGAQPVDGDSPLFGLAETAGVVAKYEVLGRGIASLGGAATGAVRDFASLDEATRQLNEVFGTTESTSGQLIGKLQDVAASGGIATADLIKASTTAGAALGGDTGTGRAQAASESAPAIRDSSIITGQDSSSSAAQLVAIGTAYGLAGNQISQVNDAVANARKEFGGNAAEVQKALAGLAVVGPQAGYSLDQLALSVGKVQAATGEGGSQIASSLTRIFNVLEKPTSRTELADKLGISLTGDAKNGIEQLAQAFPTLNNSQRVFLENTAGGARGLRSLVPLLADQPGLQAAFSRALSTSGIGADAANASLNGLGGQLRAFGAGVKEAAVNIAQSGVLDPFVLLFETLRPGLSLLNQTVKSFNDISPAVRGTALSIGELIIAVNALKLIGGTNLGSSLIGALPSKEQLAQGAANVRTGGLAQQVGGIFRGERAKDDAGLRSGERQAGGGLFGNPFAKVAPEQSAAAGLKAANERFIAVVEDGAAKLSAANLTAANAAAAGGAGSEASTVAQANLARVTSETAALQQAAAREVSAAQALLSDTTSKAVITQEANSLAVAESTGVNQARVASDVEVIAGDSAAALAATEKAAADGLGAIASQARVVADGAAVAVQVAHTEAQAVDTASVLANARAMAVSTLASIQKGAGSLLDIVKAGPREGSLLSRLGIGSFEKGGLQGLLRGGASVGGSGLALGAGAVGGALLLDKQLYDDRRKVDASFAGSDKAQSQSAVASNSDDLRSAASALEGASKSIADSSKGPIGSIVGALTEVFGGANRGAERKFNENLAGEDRRAAGALDDERKNALGGGAFDLSAVSGVADGLKVLQRNGASAKQQLDALNGALSQVADAASGGARRVLTGQAGVLAAKTADNITQGVAAEAEAESQQHNPLQRGIFGTDTSKAGDALRKVNLEKLGGGLQDDVKTALADSGLDKGAVTPEKFAAASVEVEAALKKRLADQGIEFSKLPQETQARLLAAAKGGLAQELNKIDGGSAAGSAGKLNNDQINDVLAAAPGLAQKAGADAASAASLGGTAGGGALAGAQANVAELVKIRANLAATGATADKLVEIGLEIDKANLGVQAATITHLAAVNALATANVGQFNRLGTIDSQVAGVNEKLALATDEDQKLALQAQLRGLADQRANQLVTNVNSARRVGIDSRNVGANASADVADAKGKLDQINADPNANGQSITDAQKAYNDSLVKLAQSSVAQANLLRDSGVAVGDKVGELYAAAQDAAATAGADLAGSPQQQADRRIAAQKAIDARVAAAAQNAALAQSTIDPRNATGQAAQKLQDDIAARNALAAGDTTGRANAARQIAQDRNAITQQNVALANAQRDAATDPRDSVRQAQVALQNAQASLAAALPGQQDYADKVKASRTAQFALAQAISNAANAAQEAGIDSRDTLGEAQAKVDAAQRAVNDAGGIGPGAAVAAKALADAVLARALAQLDLANAQRSSADFPGDALQAAATAVAAATANLANDKAGTIKYFTDLAALRAAQVAYARQIEDQQNVLEQLNSDQTNPVITAQNAVDAARRKLADDTRLGAPPETIQRDTLALNNAQNNEQKTAFQQQLSDAQTNLQLHRISGAAYLQYLQTLRTNVLATGLKTRQQVDELNQVDQAILAANQQLSGQFNLGDIKVPTVYQERRQAASGGIDITGIAGVVTTNPLTQKANDVIAPLSAAVAGIKTGQAITALAGLQSQIDQFATGIGLIAGPTAQDPGAFAGSGTGNLGSPGGIATTNNVTINGVDITKVVQYLNGVLGRGAVSRNSVLSGRKI